MPEFTCPYCFGGCKELYYCPECGYHICVWCNLIAFTYHPDMRLGEFCEH